MRVNDLRANVLNIPARQLNYRFMVAEWLWIWFGLDDVQTIAQYNKNIAQFSDGGRVFVGAYGPKLQSQWPAILEKLRSDPDTRQAVVSIWSPLTVHLVTKDLPCTTTLQFLLRDGQLNCIATMRSSDVWLGLPYDFFNFSMLTNILAGELSVSTGWLQMNLGSSHLYETNYEQAQRLLQEKYDVSLILHSPQLPSFPPHEMLLALQRGRNAKFWRDATTLWDHYQYVLAAPDQELAHHLLEILGSHEWKT